MALPSRAGRASQKPQVKLWYEPVAGGTVRRARDGTTWRIGTDAEVAWIANGTSMGPTITAAITPVFEAYATVVLPYGEEQGNYDRAVLALLAE